jgi:hypothetical protein
LLTIQLIYSKKSGGMGAIGKLINYLLHRIFFKMNVPKAPFRAFTIGVEPAV